jgi:hypothetical protein
MRLVLQFATGTVVVRGMADIGLALKLIAYLDTWNATTMAMPCQEIHGASQLSLSPPPPQLAIASPMPERFWEYAVDDPSTRVAEPVKRTDSLHGLSVPLPAIEVPQTILPWTEDNYHQHDQHLKHLQAEREIRFYGFDAAALAKRLRDEPLEHIEVSIPLQDGEFAHYHTEVQLFDAEKYAKSKAKDQGTLILTNRRMIYRGQKRHIVLGYERVLLIEQVKGALVLSSEYWTKKQSFSMQHPLECAMYFERILQCFQQTVSSTRAQTQALDVTAWSPRQAFPIVHKESDTSN